MLQRILLVALTLVVSPATLGQTWHLQDCPPENAATYQKTRATIENLSPGDRGYRPHPFPNTTQEVVEDFLHSHRRVFSQVAFENLPPADQRLFASVDSGKADYTMRRVANWTPTRCQGVKRQDFYYLVQVVDSETGIEVTRFAVDAEGSVIQVRHRFMEPIPEYDLSPIPGLTKVRSEHIRNQLSAPPKRPQYVALWGSVRCPVVDPCIAFQAGQETYFTQADTTYRVNLARGLMKASQKMGSGPAKTAFMRGLAERNEMFTSIGANDLAYITPVEP